MNVDQFWEIVQKSRKDFQPDQPDGNMDRQAEALKHLLSALPADEVIQFSRIMGDFLRRSYSWELWGAAYIIAGGCSDDGFDYFRAWLISMGRRVFDEALADAEALRSSAYAPGVEDIFFEDFLYIPSEVLEKMGAEIPDTRLPPPTRPSGKEWRENTDDLKLMFPKLWERAQQQRRGG